MSSDLLEMVSGALYEVNIVSPYLIPTPELIEAFKKLIANNVRIRIITNSLKSTDNLLAQAGYREVKPLLIKMGVELYEYNGPDTIHAKTALIDNRTSFIGTYNIDPRSAFINREIGVIVSDTENTGYSKELARIIDDFRQNSTLVGKDGVAHNQELEMQGVSRFRRAILRSITFILPWIRNQL